ncbi:MAG: TetR/AcrR family transcriptional regulator [Ruminococcaceae bacterium]|nr:TetR/AcrR family transcriptional regulator [Oscillospiraceae bacterium]
MPKIIENVREQLLSEARRQVSERGYANTTIRSVAGECGLAVGTVYNYFKSKDMLIASFMVEDWECCLKQIREHRVADLKDYLKFIYDSLIDFMRDHSALFSDKEAGEVSYTAFHERHRLLRDQLAAMIVPILHDSYGDRSEFASRFIAESLLTWTVEKASFDEIYDIIGKIINNI